MKTLLSLILVLGALAVGTSCRSTSDAYAVEDGSKIHVTVPGAT